MGSTDTRSDQSSAPPSSGPAVDPLPRLDYALMRGAMIQWVQELAGDRWTNYNESDPGVTILEILCYALTELGLRAEQPIPVLLASPQSLRVQLHRQGLYAAQDILPGPALTLLDQRRWLLDQIPPAANIWLTPRSEGVRGLIQAEVLPRWTDLGPCVCSPEEEAIRDELVEDVRRCASRCRNLGEDLDEVVVLKPQPLTLAARVRINSQRHPDEILAEMLFRVGLVLAPEPRRHSLEERLNQGMTSADLYLGPPMQRGFLADDDLLAVIQQPSVRALREVMAAVSGVLEVEELRVSWEGQPELDAAQGSAQEGTLVLKPGCYPRLQVDLNATPLPLTLVRDAHPEACNPERVQRLLNRWWQDHRQSFNLDQAGAQAFSLSPANSAEDGDYSSIQTLFPAVYGLGAKKDDPSLSPKQQGQIKQLKGYLMLFDQLMADFAAQLAFLRDLFSPLAGGGQTYATRSLRLVSGCEPDLLIGGYERQQAALRQRLDPKEQRQARILDFLLSLYGQSLLPHTNTSGSPAVREEVAPRLLQAKQELLRDVVELSRERGCGVNYRDPDLRMAPTALERRCALELRVRRPAAESSGVVLEAEAEKASFGRLLSGERTRRVRESFLALDGLMAPLTRPDDRDGRTDPFAGRTVATVLWPALANPRRYRIGGCEVGDDVDLVCLDDSGGCWWLGSFAHARLAHAHARQLLALADARTDAVHLIEWVLLRHALSHPGAKGLPEDLFHFVVSVVVMREGPSGGQSEMVATLLRPHIPAHLEMRVHVLGPRRFSRFIDHREAWLRSLGGDDADQQARTAYRLATFLRDSLPPSPSEPSGPATEPATETKVATDFAPMADSSAAPTSAPAAPPSSVPPSPVPQPPAGTDPIAAGLSSGSAQPPLRPAPLLLMPARTRSSLAWSMVAAPAVAGAEGVRCDNPVELASLGLWRQAGLRFLMRPLAWRAGLEGALTGEELERLLRLGFALMPFQDPSSPPGPAPERSVPPSPKAMDDLGRSHGEAAVAAAKSLDIQCPAAVIWLADHPRNAADDPASRMRYVNSWSQAIQAAGFASGVLLTTATPLTNLRCDWLGRWDPAVAPPMLGFGLIREPASEKQALLAGQGDILRMELDRRGTTPPWLTLDPRALPPAPP